MAHDHTPVELDPSQIIRAEHGWHAFTQYGKWFVLCVIAIVILMAIFLI